MRKQKNRPSASSYLHKSLVFLGQEEDEVLKRTLGRSSLPN
ncbi:hypothetical protein [Mesobacillus persicus]|nr:hypothetical protein [Mesobacillus persicus]